MGLVIGAIGWSIAAVVVSQGTSILLMWWLGLPPKKLIHEIEEVQNSAVGACFFIVSLAVSIFISQFVTNGYTDEGSIIAGAAWIAGAFVLGTVIMGINFFIAHRVMDPQDETVIQYIRRELIEEQNASLAFFLGGLAIASYISVIYQMI
jgi:ABC-type multidrug transport system fused ATPase/permease subunit